MNCEEIDKYDYLIAMAALDAKNDDVEMFKSLDASDVVLSDKIVREIGKLIKISHKIHRIFSCICKGINLGIQTAVSKACRSASCVYYTALLRFGQYKA